MQEVLGMGIGLFQGLTLYYIYVLFPYLLYKILESMFFRTCTSSIIKIFSLVTFGFLREKTTSAWRQ
uniref:Ovule protein n=1 Tax=Heterorhabditis bacteriophora TaxID=37862 RepID=A0A1I7WZ69_HETBA